MYVFRRALPSIHAVRSNHRGSSSLQKVKLRSHFDVTEIPVRAVLAVARLRCFCEVLVTMRRRVSEVSACARIIVKTVSANLVVPRIIMITTHASTNTSTHNGEPLVWREAAKLLAICRQLDECVLSAMLERTCNVQTAYNILPIPSLVMAFRCSTFCLLSEFRK